MISFETALERSHWAAFAAAVLSDHYDWKCCACSVCGAAVGEECRTSDLWVAHTSTRKATVAANQADEMLLAMRLRG